MAKLEKKVLKILKTRQFEDLDAEDIAMQFKGNDDEVQEALDSLQGQGLVESYEKEGKKYWRLSVDEPLEKPGKLDKFDEAEYMNSDTVSFDVSSLKQLSKATSESVPQKEESQISIDFFAVSEPDKPTAAIESFSPQPLASEPQFLVSKPQPRASAPQHPDSEQVKVKTDTPIPPPVMKQEPPPVMKQEPPAEKLSTHTDYDYDDDDDTDQDIRPAKPPMHFHIIGIAVAIVFSVVISAMIAMMIATNTGKELSISLDELGKKLSEANVKQDQKIDKLYEKVNAFSNKSTIPQRQAKPAAPRRTVKPSPAKYAKQSIKRALAPRKKKIKSFSSNEEISTTPSASEASSSSNAASPSASDWTPPSESAPFATEPPSIPPSTSESETSTSSAEGSSQ